MQTFDIHICTKNEKPVTEEVIEKWYKKLGFPKYFDEEFYEALREIKISDAITVEEYNEQEKDGRRNFLSFLYFCKDLQKKYEAMGIPEEILLDTLHDLVIWTDIWSGLKGGLYLGELAWLKLHLSGKLFKLGRLQYCINESHYDAPDKGIKKGDAIIDMHIPAVGPLIKEECEKSLAMAREFFAAYFPEFEYEHIVCHSWLLGLNLADYLPAGSNILKFQELFDIVEQDADDAILRYVFQWQTNRHTVISQSASSGFAQKIKKAAMSGATFYSGLGVVKKT